MVLFSVTYSVVAEAVLTRTVAARRTDASHEECGESTMMVPPFCQSRLRLLRTVDLVGSTYEP